MKWVGRIFVLAVLAYVCITSYRFIRRYIIVDHSSVQIALTKLPEATKWISSIPNLTEGQHLTLPVNLKDMIGPGGKVFVRKYDDNLWVVFECYVENIDNGEGYAYCANPKAGFPQSFDEQPSGEKRINQNWVWFRFT